MAEPAAVPAGCDKLWYAHLQLRRRDYDRCAELCTELLTANPKDQARALLRNPPLRCL